MFIAFVYYFITINVSRLACKTLRIFILLPRTQRTHTTVTETMPKKPRKAVAEKNKSPGVQHCDPKSTQSLIARVEHDAGVLLQKGNSTGGHILGKKGREKAQANKKKGGKKKGGKKKGGK
jgi:hypothetical protein